MKKQVNKKHDDMLQALKQLKQVMQRCKNKTCYAIVQHVSSSGMSRCIHYVAITRHGEYYNLDGYIHRILGYSFSNSGDGLRVSGCGMDMIFHVLYQLNSVAIYYGVVKPSKKKTRHDIQYNGVINTSYRYF